MKYTCMQQKIQPCSPKTCQAIQLQPMQSLGADLCGIFLAYAALHSQGLLLMKKYHVIF